MGVIIVGLDYDSRIFPVNPMPSPDYNILNAIQTLASGASSSIATNVLRRDGSYVMNDITATMIELKPFFTDVFTLYKNMDANTIKVLYSLLTKGLVTFGLNKVPILSWFYWCAVASTGQTHTFFLPLTSFH